MTRTFLGFAVRTWWTLVIAVVCSTISAGAAALYATDRANSQFRHTLLLSNQQFQQANRLASAQGAYAQNKSACGFRGLVRKARQRARAVLAPGSKAPAAAKTAARQTLADISTFLETQVTVPADFDCSTLPKKPPG